MFLFHKCRNLSIREMSGDGISQLYICSYRFRLTSVWCVTENICMEVTYVDQRCDVRWWLWNARKKGDFRFQALPTYE